MKPELRQRFLAGLDTLDVERPWRSFPLPALATEAPIEAFHRFLGLCARTQIARS